jgi:hypothetical protein
LITLKFVRYDGTGNGYLLILTNKKRSGELMREAGEVPVAALYIPNGQIVAVSEQDFQILNEQGHIGKEKLREVPDEDKEEHFTKGTRG